MKMSNSMITYHLAIKAALQRADEAVERQQEARKEYERTGLASKKDRIETASIERQSAYRELRKAVDALIEGGF
jgi:uncharacterized coiled-coil DUF342 family protein